MFCAVSPLLDVFQSTLPRRERRDEKSRHESSYAFQSTLPRRERLSVGFFQLVLHNFNPRSREGSDPSATCCRWMSRNFNPRSREGSDPGNVAAVLADRGFQSTLPRRERRRADKLRCLHRDFNPRSREGSDSEHEGWAIITEISIHAPAKGATLWYYQYKAISSISIHAPAKGATFIHCWVLLSRLISIHAPAKGATTSP